MNQHLMRLGPSEERHLPPAGAIGPKTITTRMRNEQLSAEAFYEAIYQRLVAAIFLQCGDRNVAEDLTQEAGIRLFTHWKRINRKDNPWVWIHRVGMNLATSQLRRRMLERKANTLVGNSGSEIADIASTDSLLIREALLELPTRERQALILRHFVGLSVHEVAHSLDCSERTVKRLTQKAVAQLQNDENIAPMIGETKNG